MTDSRKCIPSDSQKEYEKELIIEQLLMEGVTSTYKDAEEKAIVELNHLYHNETK